MDLRKEFAQKRYLDTLMHTLVAISLIIVLNYFIKDIKIEKLIILVFSGSFSPDLDHLLLYKLGRFKSFKDFLRWTVRSNRYRIGLEIFHNLPVVLFLLIALPVLYIKNIGAFIFFLSFLFHLLVDISIDKLVLRSLKQWRFTSKI